MAQIKARCLKAWSKMEEAGTPAQSFPKVMQKLHEPYTDLLARLHKAFQRTVNGEEAQSQLPLSLEAGSNSYNANLLADALKTAIPRPVKCYGCGKVGHMNKGIV